MRALLRKIVPGVFSAVGAVTVATLSVSVVAGEVHWFGLGAAIRVGLPAFVVGMLFFPVDEQALASRLGFALRAGFATAAAALVHRVLWTAMDLELAAVGEVLRNPATLWPSGSPDATALLAASAIAGATAAGALVQPALKRLARGRRPSVASALSALDSTAGRRTAQRVR